MRLACFIAGWTASRLGREPWAIGPLVRWADDALAASRGVGAALTAVALAALLAGGAGLVPPAREAIAGAEELA